MAEASFARWSPWKGGFGNPLRVPEETDGPVGGAEPLPRSERSERYYFSSHQKTVIARQ